VTGFSVRASVAVALLCLVPLPGRSTAFAQTPSKPTAAPANELDAFMEKVLKRREFNRQTLEQYVLDETEQIEVLGPSRMPLFRQKREFTWYVRDGLHVRSPVKFDGVNVGDEARWKYEEDWARRERSRLERRKEDDSKKQPAEPSEPADPAAGPQGATPIPTPRFVSEAYFMEFKFEPGNYYLVAREQLEGKDVLRIEYYPKNMFNDSDEKDEGEKKEQQEQKENRREGREARRERELEDRIERQMNKTALVTLWVDPTEHQIVKYTFDNVWMDFLPGGWLVKVDDISASMTMGQPFPGVWLPRGMNVHAGITLASGSFEAAYQRLFADYKQAETATKIRIPKHEEVLHEEVLHERVLHERVLHEEVLHGRVLHEGVLHEGVLHEGVLHEGVLHEGVLHEGVLHEERSDDDTREEPSREEPSRKEPFREEPFREEPFREEPFREEPFREEPFRAEPFRAEPSVQNPSSVQNPPEVIGDIRVHGNAYLNDEEVIRLAGIALGQPLAPDGLLQIEQRLKKSGHFETVEVLKRYRSLTNTSDVAVVLLVHERPGLTSATVPEENAATRPFRWLTSHLMFLPILSYDDGYGFTYGGRVSAVDLLGAGERLSVPLTWGGTRRAALEFERTFKSGPLTRIDSSFGIWQRENPHYELDDQRVEWTARAERSFAGLVRTGVETSVATVEFGTLDDRLWTLGANVTLDTRGDPAFPRNAVLLGAGWTGLDVKRLDKPINLLMGDARGYLGVIRQAVLAGRVQYIGADRPLPPYEQLLLGGASNLRGFAPGTFASDRQFVTSAELRVPITSVLSGAKLGLTAFFDASKAFNVGQRLQDASWHQGVGGGVFLIATIVKINVDVAHGLKDGETRVSLSTGFAF
jgi:Omp85 superfamily domain/Surface antigen variable number repeat